MTARARSRSEHIQKAQLAVIDALYATVTDPERWAEVVRAATNLIGGGISSVPVSAPRQTKRPDEARLRSLFDLTPAEARLVAALYEGRTLASYADRTGTSLNTVKTHLKHVFGKTGETRQVDLVRRVATDLALRFEAGAFK